MVRAATRRGSVRNSEGLHLAGKLGRSVPIRTVVVDDDGLVLHFGHLHAAVGLVDVLVGLHAKHLCSQAEWAEFVWSVNTHSTMSRVTLLTLLVLGAVNCHAGHLGTCTHQQKKGEGNMKKKNLQGDKILIFQALTKRRLEFLVPPLATEESAWTDFVISTHSQFIIYSYSTRKHLIISQ